MPIDRRQPLAAGGACLASCAAGTRPVRTPAATDAAARLDALLAAHADRLPGRAGGGANRGVIRTGHAARALRRRDTPERRDEPARRPRRAPPATSVLRRLVVLVLAALAAQGLARGQDLEPRRWTHLPAGTNSIGLAYAYTRGDVAFDPVLELQDVTVESHTAVASYVRAFDFLGATGRLDLIAPLQRTRWEGSVSGTPGSRTVDGPDDPWVRFSVDFVGAPALQGKAFMDHVARNPVRTVVGAGIGVRLPLGDYDPDRLLNIGQNRFTFMPQVGVVHTRGPWSFELTQSTLLFTDNDDFFGGKDLEQDPIFALQSHVVRTFENQVWIAAGAGYSTGGEAEIDGEAQDDERASVLVGCSVGMPLGQGSGLKLAYLHNDARRSVGSDLDSFVLGWTLRF